MARGPERASETKADGWHVYDVDVQSIDVVVRLHAAQDQDGRWWGSDSVEFGVTLGIGMPSRQAVLVPSIAIKWGTEAEALVARCQEIRDWCDDWITGSSGVQKTAWKALSDATLRFEHEVQSHIARRFAAEAAAIKCGPLPKPNGKAKAVTSPRTPKREIVSVAIDKIHRHPHNRTILPASCEGLADSLRRRGLLSPIRVRAPGEHWMLPEGHLQLIDGERRLVAARLAGWDVIDAVVVEIGDAEAEAEIAAANGQRQDLNDIERADRLAWLQRPLAEGGGGLTQTQAAAEMGISQPTASLLQSVGRLPDPWRAAIIAGEIPGSHLRPVAQYADCPGVLALLWEDYRWAMGGDSWRQEDWESRVRIEETVGTILQNDTRPLTRQDVFGRNDYYLPAFDAAALDEPTRKKLQIVEVKDEAGDTVRRCLNRKLWGELNQKFEKAHGTGGNGKAGKSPLAKAAKPKKTPAEQRKADAKADQELRDRIQLRGGLAEIALRIDLASKLRPGDYVTENLHDDLVATTRNAEYNSSLDYDEWKYLAERLLFAERLGKGRAAPKITAGHKTAEAYQGFATRAVDWENDPLSDGQRRRWHVCQLLLWPCSDVIEHQAKIGKAGEWPGRFPWIEPTLLSFYATLAEASVRGTWEHARVSGGPAHAWFVQFVRTFNTTRQRQGLCSELGVTYQERDKLADLEDAIVRAHKDRRLKLPALLDMGFKGKGKKGGGK